MTKAEFIVRATGGLFEEEQDIKLSYLYMMEELNDHH